MAEKIQTVEELLAEAKEIYRKEFKEEPNVAVYAPGRVNLIGEHVDYNDGFVLPMALPMGTIMVGKKISGQQSVVVTTSPNVDKPNKATIEMPSKDALVRGLVREPPKWSNYVRGVIANYKGETPTFNAVIHNNVPIGGGLSSSASLEVAVYIFLDALNGTSAGTPTEKALACQKAEHDYADMPCGIMDQFIAVMGKKDNALLIDCRSMTSSLVPFELPGIVVLITNSGVKHELTGSEYPTRRKQCQEAALILKKLSLRDATPKDIEYLQSIDADPTMVKRARHVIGEITRVKDAVEALKQKNFHKFGELMVESHNALRDDFEVSCPEIDQLVEVTLKADGVLGSRITGGGFGGCTVTLVNASVIDKVIEHIKKNYKGTPTFYVCKPFDGAHILDKKPTAAAKCSCKK